MIKSAQVLFCYTRIFFYEMLGEVVKIQTLRYLENVLQKKEVNM